MTDYAKLIEDVSVLQSTLLEDEIRYDDALPSSTIEFWRNLDPQTSEKNVPLPLIFTVSLPRNVSLKIHIQNPTGPHDLAVICDDRSLQTDLSEKISGMYEEAQEQDLPLFTVFSSLQSYLLSEVASPPPTETAQPSMLDIPQAPLLTTKCALLWSHHLLATSKRKDIHHWSTELQVWTISKIGYPGVIVVEGIDKDVDEFLRRIKALQWYALQVRYEESKETGERDKSTVLSTLCDLRLGVHSGSGSGDAKKPSNREVDSMSDLGALMKAANLSSVFATAMKLPKLA